MTEQTTNNNFEQSWEPEIAKQIQMAVDGRRRPEDANSNSNSNRTQPYMVAIVGIPGGGKSVSSFLVTHLLEEQGIESMIMPHDGYHYPLEHLKMFPNPHDVIYRRGAPDTFDPQALQRDLERIRTGDEEVIKVPGFDHSKGDPEPDAHMFDRTRHQVVLCEGLVSHRIVESSLYSTIQYYWFPS
jgi:pantothenate kinase